MTTTRSSILLLLLALAVPSGAQVAPRPFQGGRVLVVPFENVNREGRLYWLSEASAVLLADELAALGADTIDRDERVHAFEQLQLPPATALSEATIIRVGQLVGAAQVVVGSFTASGNDLTVKGRSIRLDSGRMEADAVEHGSIANLYGIFTALTARVLSVPAERIPPGTFGREPLRAFESYIKGLVAESPAARIRFLGQTLEASSGFDHARLALWQVHTSQGDHARAAAAAAAVPASSPLSRRARFLVALSRMRLRQYDEAFVLLKGILDEAPAAAIYNNLGVVQSHRGSTPQTGKATYYFHKAVEADPNDPDYAFNLGYAYWVDHDPQATIYWLKEAVRRNPGDGEAHFVLGTALLGAGGAAEGERERELARQLSSTFREWERRAGTGDPVPRSLERVRDDLDAPRARSVDTVLTAGGQRDQEELAAFHLDRARRLMAGEQDQEAVRELKRSLYLSPYQADALLLLGRIHLRAGRLRDAVDALKISLWSRESVAAHVALGEAYLAAGDLLQARTEADRALAADPTDPGAKMLRDKTGPR